MKSQIHKHTYDVHGVLHVPPATKVPVAAHAVDVLVAALAVPVKPATARPRTQNTPSASARKL